MRHQSPLLNEPPTQHGMPGFVTAAVLDVVKQLLLQFFDHLKKWCVFHR
jgi:hypothetical protein